MTTYAATTETGMPRRKSFWDIILSERYFKWTLIVPLLITLAAFMLYPTFYSLYYVFMRFVPLKEASVFVGLDNLRFVLHHPHFLGDMANTFAVLVGCLIVELVLGMLIALLFSREFRGQNLIRGLCLLPLLMSPLIMSMVWGYLLQFDYGFMNQILSKVLQLPKVVWWGPTMAKVSVILLTSWQWTPFTVFVLVAGLRSLPKDAFEAARVDGAGAWYTFRRLTLPMLSPLIVIIVMLRSMWLMRLFDPLYGTTRGGAGTESVDYLLYRTAFSYFDIGQACTIAIIALFLTLIFSFILYRQLMHALGVIK